MPATLGGKPVELGEEPPPFGELLLAVGEKARRLGLFLVPLGQRRQRFGGVPMGYGEPSPTSLPDHRVENLLPLSESPQARCFQPFRGRTSGGPFYAILSAR
jgi:hypothetical protein